MALCALGLSVACSGKTTTTGELMLAMNTDMSLPKDVDEVRIQIKVSGRVMYDDRYSVGPGDGKVKIPATLGVVAGNDGGAVVRIKVSASQNKKSRMLREVTTTVPPDRIALLRIPIQWISDGSAIDVDGDDVVSACPDGQTNIAGTCQDMAVSSADLPSYSPADVFGGGAESGGGTCFDTLPCFAEASTAQVDLTNCTIPAQSGDLTKVNVGLTLALGDDGICSDKACYIGLDANSPAGWNVMGGTSSGEQVDAGAQGCRPVGSTEGCPGGMVCGPDGTCQPLSTEQDAGVKPPPVDDGGSRIPAPRIRPLGDPAIGDANAAPLGGPIQLPKAICEKLKSGRVKSVVTSFACPSKTEKNPTCGPWSAIGGGTTPTIPTNPKDAGSDAPIADAAVPACGAVAVPTAYAWAPPVATSPMACNEAALASFATVASSGNATIAALEASVKSWPPCVACIFGRLGDSQWKAIQTDRVGNFAGNLGGCAMRVGASPTCGQSIETENTCGETICSTCAPGSDAANSCYAAVWAEGGACGNTVQNVARDCTQLPSGAVTAACGKLQDLVRVFCGPTAQDGGSCLPRTCADLGMNCGPQADGCGGTLPSCGNCTAPLTCGGAGEPGRCG